VQAEDLKALVEAGLYKPDPAQVAAAMLERRGVRELLTLGCAAGEPPSGPPGGRSLAEPEARPRAA